MFKPNKLLKVVSIIFIVLAVMGAIGTVGSYFMLQSMGDVVNGVDMSAVKAMATPLTLLQGLFSSLLMLVCGIFGLNGKSFKVCLIGMIIYLVIVVIAFIQSIMLVGFQVFPLSISFCRFYICGDCISLRNKGREGAAVFGCSVENKNG